MISGMTPEELEQLTNAVPDFPSKLRSELDERKSLNNYVNSMYKNAPRKDRRRIKSMIKKNAKRKVLVNQVVRDAMLRDVKAAQNYTSDTSVALAESNVITTESIVETAARDNSNEV